MTAQVFAVHVPASTPGSIEGSTTNGGIDQYLCPSWIRSRTRIPAPNVKRCFSAKASMSRGAGDVQRVSRFSSTTFESNQPLATGPAPRVYASLFDGWRCASAPPCFFLRALGPPDPRGNRQKATSRQPIKPAGEPNSRLGKSITFEQIGFVLQSSARGRAASTPRLPRRWRVCRKDVCSLPLPVRREDSRLFQSDGKPTYWTSSSRSRANRSRTRRFKSRMRAHNSAAVPSPVLNTRLA